MNYQSYYHQVGTDSLTTKVHTATDHFEFIQIIDGKGIFLLGEKTYPFAPNDIFFFDGSLPHYLNPEVANIYSRNKLIIEKKSFSLFMKQQFPKNIYFNASIQQAQEIDALFYALNAATSNGQEFLSLSLIFQLLHICQQESTALTPSESDFIRQIFLYINQHLQEEDLSIDQIAEYMHTNKYYLCHRFKSETGFTIGTYIKLQRIHNAKKRLEGSDDTISVIAQDCGFNDCAYFTKVFKQVEGITPSAYRKTLHP